MKIIHYTATYLLVLIMLAAAIGKLIDLNGYFNVVESYQLIPQWAIWPAMISILVTELFIAVSLLCNWKIKLGLNLSIALNSLFAIVLTIELIRGVPLSNCGCFGVFLARPLTWFTPIEDLIMVALTLIAKRTLKSRTRKV